MMLGFKIRRSAKQNHDCGFTLIEMLVTVGVFAVVMMISSSIFINVNNLQQQTGNMGKLQNEGRYMLEKIGKEIRGRELDYAAIGDEMNQTTGMTDTLIFKQDEFGDVYSIYYEENSIKVGIFNNEEGTKIAPLNSDDVTVGQLQFRISPVTDPYDIFSDALPLQQPRVTIMMIIENRNVPERYKKILQLQTTISSKIYK